MLFPLNDLSPYLALALRNTNLYSELKQTLDELEKAQQKEFGISAVIGKPFRIGDILQAIRETISHSP